MNIWYDILFAINSISKIMQSKDMHIDVAIDHLRGLITYLKNYRENGFESELEYNKEMNIEMDIEPKFNEKQILTNKINTPLKILNYIKRSCSFSNTCIAYRILLTLPVIVVTTKRNFSKLKLIKSYLRSTMLQDRLNKLAILSIESEMLELLDYKNLINNFATQKVKKITKIIRLY
uniref:HAT C-terminal dimerisation domain-containing protein n=1 Tax=Cajanus cajan TaxID=3821 RepID=A0A151QME3_CAJCA|nr:hypothetical protein KK1_048263 [Cajanus cajan]